MSGKIVKLSRGTMKGSKGGLELRAVYMGRFVGYAVFSDSGRLLYWLRDDEVC